MQTEETTGETATLDEIFDGVDDLNSGIEEVFEQFEGWLNQTQEQGSFEAVTEAKLAMVNALDVLLKLQSAIGALVKEQDVRRLLSF